MKKSPLPFLALILLLSACQSKTAGILGQKVIVPAGSYSNVSPQELSAMLDHKDFVLVNVHIPYQGNIRKTDLSIPYDKITEAANLAELPADRKAKIVLYCRSGHMSAIAAEALIRQGYSNIWNLAGGMVAWEQAGFNVEK